jgi:hypothetical protein
MFSRFLAAAFVFAAPVVAGATTLIDGSFETKGSDTPVTRYCYDGFATADGPCAASPWVGNGIIHTGEGAWGSPAAPDGIYLAFVQGSGVLSQSFTATATSGLAVNWFDAARVGYSGSKTYSVSITHGVMTTVVGTYTASTVPFIAETSANFGVVAGETYTLSFTGIGNEDRTAFIDNVSLTTVPEPASWALLVTGFGLVGFAARRRSAAVSA